jgi:hypothetical protein
MTARFRLTLSVLSVALLGLLAPLALRADNLVFNGNFASGGTDWTFTPAAQGSDFNFGSAYSTTTANFGGVSAGYYDTITQSLSTQSGYGYTLRACLRSLFQGWRETPDSYMQPVLPGSNQEG